MANEEKLKRDVANTCTEPSQGSTTGCTHEPVLVTEPRMMHHPELYSSLETRGPTGGMTEEQAQEEHHEANKRLGTRRRTESEGVVKDGPEGAWRPKGRSLL